MSLINKDISKCYACDQKSVSREHVPPHCFFPKGFRKDLLTVPSCKRHNQDNSINVEYVRDIITTCFQVNNIGFTQFENKTFKSVTRNNSLIHKLLNNSMPALISGKETRAIEIDLNIFDIVFNLIGKALYYYDFKKRLVPKFKTYPVSFFFDQQANNEERNEYTKIIYSLNSLAYEEMKNDNPKVFKYYRYKDKDSIIYRTDFYEGFIVFLAYVK
jgi:hypothetical protein